MRLYFNLLTLQRLFRAMQAESQAQKAEKMAKDVLGRLETALNRLEKISTTSGGNSYSLYNAESMPVIPNQEQPGEDDRIIEEKKPFWSIPRAKVEFTTQELGKGRWGVVRVATYEGQNVAARCFYRQSIHKESKKVFIESMEAAATLRHANILPLIGVVLEGEPVILTEIMPMNLKKVLDMGQLYNYQISSIALDVANALLFLHETKPNPLFHGDLPSTSVLVQKGADNLWRAKLYKFMLSKYARTSAVFSHQGSFDRDRSLSPTIQEEGVSTSRSSTPRITPPPSLGYRRKISGSDLALNRRPSSRKHSQTAPDILDPVTLTPQRDVYCFGLLIVEMCTGTQPLEVSLQFLVESITWSAMFSVVKSCTEFNTKMRPPMKSLVGTLQEIDRSFATRPVKFTK